MKHLCLLLLLAGCAGGSQRLADYHGCRDRAGPEPDQAAHAFGLVGAIIMINDPDHVSWTNAVQECMDLRRMTGAAVSR